MRKIFHKDSGGFSLIDVLIGTALLAIIGVAVFSALTTGIKATFQADVRTTSVALAKSLMENVKNCEYGYAGDSDPGYKYAEVVIPGSMDFTDENIEDLSIPENFTISTLDRSNLEQVNKIYGVPWNPVTNTISSTDTGIQKVTIIIEFKNQEVFRITDFKVKR